MWGVLVMTVFWDLIGAVLVGMFVANLLTIESLTNHQLGNMNTGTGHLTTQEQGLMKRCGDDLILFRMQGPLSFGAAKGISERMMLVRKYKVLLLDITDVPHLGVTASLAIERMVKEAERQERRVLVTGASGKVKQRLAQFGIKHLIDERLEALDQAAHWINKTNN